MTQVDRYGIRLGTYSPDSHHSGCGFGSNTSCADMIKEDMIQEFYFFVKISRFTIIMHCLLLPGDIFMECC